MPTKKSTRIGLLILLLTVLLYFVGTKAVGLLAPYPKLDKSSSAVVVKNQSEEGETPITLTGTLQRTTRPAPDIAYDYVLMVPEGFTDKINASGQEDMVFKSIVVSPKDDSMRQLFEGSIGKKVTMEGNIVWGFAESRYLVVNKITQQ